MVLFIGKMSVSNVPTFGQLCDDDRVEVTTGDLLSTAASFNARTSAHRRT